jgi:uncharacterized protein (TIGR02246 family)
MDPKKLINTRGEANAMEIALPIAEKLDAAWNSRNAKAMAQLFEEQADFQFDSGAMLHNREEIENTYAESIFPEMPEPMRHKANVRNVRFIKDDVLIGDGDIELYDPTETDLQKKVHIKMLCTSILVKENGAWWISAVRLMIPHQ